MRGDREGEEDRRGPKKRGADPKPRVRGCGSNYPQWLSRRGRRTSEAPPPPRPQKRVGSLLRFLVLCSFNPPGETYRIDSPRLVCNPSAEWHTRLPCIIIPYSHGEIFRVSQFSYLGDRSNYIRRWNKGYANKGNENNLFLTVKTTSFSFLVFFFLSFSFFFFVVLQRCRALFANEL